MTDPPVTLFPPTERRALCWLPVSLYIEKRATPEIGRFAMACAGENTELR
ncbi:hypothetical protein [Pseudomonas sp. P8_241]|nr:hypothetical protein [Pseudomonas sp. P8_241]WPN45745.1 hypothetical protein QMK58_21620 [Pseudomonas sp. P8_241]